jgi:hypothetical protein
VVPVEIGGDEIDLLCDYGWLAEGHASDRKAVGRAISALLKNMG